MVSCAEKRNGKQKKHTMERALILLKKELCEWEKHYKSEKIYFAGEELDKNAVRSFAECVENIADLQQAIDILEKAKVSLISLKQDVTISLFAEIKAMTEHLSQDERNEYFDLKIKQNIRFFHLGSNVQSL